MASRDYDWRCKPGWPYKGNDHPERDPQYIKDRDDLFRKSGNGWWWGDGWWNGHNITIAERQRRRRNNGETENSTILFAAETKPFVNKNGV